MGKEDRRQIVLQFMAEHGLALPPKAIFRNLRVHRRIPFGDATVDNYLEDFVEEGLVRRVDPKRMADFEVADVKDEDRRAYYIITDEGREYIDSHI